MIALLGLPELGPEAVRLLLLVSVALAFAVYTRVHLVGGGSVSGGYVALLILDGAWSTLVGIAIATAITVLIMRGLVLRVLPMPRQIAFFVGVLVGSLAAAGLHALGLLPWVPAPLLALVLGIGSFVVPGLLAYDISHQGPGRTALALGLVAAGTTAMGLVLAPLMGALPAGAAWDTALEVRIPDAVLPLATVTAIAAGTVVRFSSRLRSGGFVGALFIAEFLTLEAFLAVGAAAAVTALGMRGLERRVALTPRQAGMVALMAGALVAWASLFWAAGLGWIPAQEAYAFTLAPLLAVGLMAADMGRPRSGITRTLLGTGIGVLVITAVVSVAGVLGQAVAWLCLPCIAIALWPTTTWLHARWLAAERVGRERPRRALA